MARKSVETFSLKNNENKTGGAKKSMKKLGKKHAKKSMKKRKLGKKSRVQSRKSKGKKMSKKLKGGAQEEEVINVNYDNRTDQTDPAYFLTGPFDAPKLPMPKVIFFDVDGTLADKGRCGSSEIHDSDTDLKKRFIKSLTYFKQKNVRLYVLTRCALNRNINRIADEYHPGNESYYKNIKPSFDKLIGADELNIATSHSSIDWAHIKSYVMEKIAEKLGIDHKDIYLFDDDRLNAKVASINGFNVITTYSEDPKDMRIKHGGLTMTDNGLRQILFDNTQEISDSDLNELITYPIEPTTFTYVSPDYVDKLSFQLPKYTLKFLEFKEQIDYYVNNNFQYQSIDPTIQYEYNISETSDPYLGYDVPGAVEV